MAFPAPLSLFARFAKRTAQVTGRPIAFMTAALVIAVWAATGPIFAFSDTWQLIVNTGTTIVTFLMVFLIQNTQNRDTQAMQVKLDELIRVNKDAQTVLLDLEELGDDDLERIRSEYRALAEAARKRQPRPVVEPGLPPTERRAR